MKRLIVLRGLPGSGKSTFVKTFFPNAVVTSADHFFTGLDGVYRFRATDLAEAHGTCRASTILAMMGDVDVIVVDNTHVTRSEFAWIAPVAKRYGYSVTEVSLFDSGLLDSELAARNSHGVPEAQIAAMRARWEN